MRQKLGASFFFWPMQSLLPKHTSKSLLGFPLEVLLGFSWPVVLLQHWDALFPLHCTEMSSLDFPFASWLSAPALHLLMCLVPPHCVQLLLSFHALLSCCRKPRCPFPSTPGALPIVSALCHLDPTSLPSSPHCSSPLLALGSCMGCCAAEAGDSVCTDSQVAGWFPVLPLYPTFPNLNAMLAFTSSFHFPPALVFVAALKLKQSACRPTSTLWLGSERKHKAQDPQEQHWKACFCLDHLPEQIFWTALKFWKTSFSLKAFLMVIGWELIWKCPKVEPFGLLLLSQRGHQRQLLFFNLYKMFPAHN